MRRAPAFHDCTVPSRSRRKIAYSSTLSTRIRKVWSVRFKRRRGSHDRPGAAPGHAIRRRGPIIIPRVKILVTGLRGTVGRALEAELRGNGHQVVGWDRAAVPIDRYDAM